MKCLDNKPFYNHILKYQLQIIIINNYITLGQDSIIILKLEQ